MQARGNPAEPCCDDERLHSASHSLAAVVLEAHGLEVAVHHRGGGEVGGCRERWGSDGPDYFTDMRIGVPGRNWCSQRHAMHRGACGSAAIWWDRLPPQRAWEANLADHGDALGCLDSCGFSIERKDCSVVWRVHSSSLKTLGGRALQI